MYTYKLWNKRSPINGVSAEDITRIYNVSAGAVGLVCDENGAAVVIQYHHANPMSDEDMTAMVAGIAGEMNIRGDEETGVVAGVGLLRNRQETLA